MLSILAESSPGPKQHIQIIWHFYCINYRKFEYLFFLNKHTPNQACWDFEYLFLNKHTPTQAC